VGNPPADKDSQHVVLLRQLGAIPNGKTNVPYVSYHPISQDLMQTTCKFYGCKFMSPCVFHKMSGRK
jgi:Asp-tRNA(Asn)/Glu-tRNA(Gln) amidotransferase A subunit family amidase